MANSPKLRALFLLLASSVLLPAQEPCAPTPAFSLCEIAFELNGQEAAAHPDPYLTVRLQAEIRSPRQKTFPMPAFWDGGRRLVIRFAPTMPGVWNYRLTSNLARFDGKVAQFEATPGEHPGFVVPANLRHWAYSESGKAHLWMGDTLYPFAVLDKSTFEAIAEARARQKFTHLRGLVLGKEEDSRKAFPSPDRPDPAFFQQVDERVRFLNRKSITVDLILGSDGNHLVKLFPTPLQRERYLRYIVARYAPMDVTWQLVQEFEEYSSARALMKELGDALKRLDPYQHPRTTHTVSTSSPLLADGWMDYILYQSSDDQLGAVEHQLHTKPFVNAEFGYEDSGAGRKLDHHVDTDTFRRRLWNATMNGQYPTFGNTGAYGGRAGPPDAKFADSPGARQMTVWFDFFARTRHWELEPHFDVDGGRALALEGVEYIVYVEKPSGPVEVLVERHGYDVAWINPVTGEVLPQKDWKGEKFVAEPPSKTQDWVLHVSREGHKEGMLRSYKFESRPVPVQEVELAPQRIPFDVVEPSGDRISISKPPKFAVKIRRDTRATRSMMYLWTGEVVAGGEGARVLGTGAQGVLKIPKSIAPKVPAVLNLRVSALNANGKAYALDKVYTLVE